MIVKATELPVVNCEATAPAARVVVAPVLTTELTIEYVVQEDNPGMLGADIKVGAMAELAELYVEPVAVIVVVPAPPVGVAVALKVIPPEAYV
jgi:hypothetical protein